MTVLVDVPLDRGMRHHAMFWSMSNSKPIAFGRVKGAVVELEHPVPELEGQRVRIEPSLADVHAAEDPDLSLTPEENARLLLEWKHTGPHGPISDEDAGID